MTTHFPALASNGAGHREPYRYAHLIRRPGDAVTSQRFEFERLSQTVRSFLSYQVGQSTRDEAARALWVQGRPGEGKSVGCIIACLNAGFAVAVVSPGLFAGETEGKAVEVLHDLLAELMRWSIENELPVVVIIDDFDLSTANIGENTGHTVNSQLLVNEFMALADHRHRYRTPYGNIAFIFTVNDATGMRERLHRSGRAIWYDNVPTAEDKANIAWATLAPKASTGRALVDALGRRHRKQPVAFWNAL
ncbi:MAG: AAA family ATPase, partial [Hyphomicrobium sp.]|nr:AAA family ATPase [Hyphomicrobium sp.]